MSEQVMTKLAKLRENLKSLQHQLDRLNGEAERWAQKRNSIHQQIKDLRLEVAKAREQRDAANTKAKAWKMKRNRTRALLTKKKEESRRLKETLQRLSKKKPKPPVEAVKREKEQIEWQIQTSSLTLQEERLLVEQVNQLETQLDIYEEINNTKEKIGMLRDAIGKMNTVAALAHTHVLELAQKSQEFHQKMVNVAEKIEALQIDADVYHQNFIQSREKYRKIYEEYAEVKQEIEIIEEELAEKEEQEKLRRREETRNKIKADALAKLEKGQKLTWEEFRLLADEST